LRFAFAASVALVCAFQLPAQNAALSMTHAPGVAGAKVTMPISLAVPPGAKIAALQWSLIYPDSDIVSVNVAAAPAIQMARKTVVCSGKRGSATCVLFGMNQSVMPDGVLVEVTFELSQQPHTLIDIELKNMVAATPVGGPVAVSTISETKIVVAPRAPGTM
jgi:hypothetical protein